MVVIILFLFKRVYADIYHPKEAFVRTSERSNEALANDLCRQFPCSFVKVCISGAFKRGNERVDVMASSPSSFISSLRIEEFAGPAE
jgi:hypothetical protein